MKKGLWLCLFILTLLVQVSFGQTQKIIRGPYLNMATPSSITIRWRTDLPANSRVLFGTTVEDVKEKVTDLKLVTDHEVLLTNLQPSTKYYYTVGTNESVSRPHLEQYFRTAPRVGSTDSIRIWALGDFGNSSKNQAACSNAISKFTKNHRPDAWIWLGDNAYSYGREEEYQKHVFRVYQESFFKNTPLYPAPGNHDYGDGDRTKSQHIPYFNIFSMPQNGEAGGVPSSSESYYSVDFGNVHLVSLDSYGLLDGGHLLSDTIGKQVQWLKQDLEANKLPWTIVYWHHSPYSKGSHDTDTEEDLIKIRENFLPVLERYKVDLVLCGHSHVYERTHPILGHYGMANTFDPKKHVVAQSDAPNKYRVNGARQGIIYIVNGSGGQVGGKQNGYPLKAATYSNNSIGGSMLLDFSGNRLDAKWICADGVVRDQFSIVKETIN